MDAWCHSLPCGAGHARKLLEGVKTIRPFAPQVRLGLTLAHPRVLAEGVGEHERGVRGRCGLRCGGTIPEVGVVRDQAAPDAGGSVRAGQASVTSSLRHA